MMGSKMSRSQMISVLANMSDDKLVQALESTGVETGNEGGFDLGDESAEGLESWNAKDVAVEPANKPQFLDSSKFVVKPAIAMRRPEYYQGDDMGGLTPFMPSAEAGQT